VINRDDVFSAIKANMVEIIEGARGKEIQETQSLVRDFGADSLEIVEVVSRTMKRLKLKVPRTQLAEAKSLGELVDLFLAAAAAAGR
jgi:acyl carrier protein